MPLPSPILCEVYQETQGVIDGGGITERLGHIGVEKHDVRAGLVGAMVLAAHASRKVVLREDVCAYVSLDLVTHAK